MFYIVQILLLHEGIATSCSKPEMEAGPAWRELTSPFWPQAIHPKLECEWRIQAPPGKRVQIHFDLISLSEETNQDGHCKTQMIDLIDGSRISETTNNYISFCGHSLPSIDFVTETEVARIWLKSDLPKELVTGEEKYRIKFKSTDEQPNVQDYISGTVRTEKAGYMTRNPIKLRNGLRNRNPNKILNNFGNDYEGYEEETSRTTGTGGRIRPRAKIGEYNPNRVIKARPTLTAPKATFETSQDDDIIEGGGKMMAAVASGSLIFLVLVVAISVCCWRKYAKDPSTTGTGPMVYCASTHRYITVNT